MEQCDTNATAIFDGTEIEQRYIFYFPISIKYLGTGTRVVDFPFCEVCRE